LGTIFQSQSRTNEASWGTKAMDSLQVYEASDLNPELLIQEFEVNEPFRSSKVSYKLGKNGRKIVKLGKDKIQVEVFHSGTFTEILPILISENDLITINGGQIKIETRKGTFSINTSEKDGIKIKDFETDLENKKCKVVEISAKNKLTYEFIFK
jgi:hypothetical protein